VARRQGAIRLRDGGRRRDRLYRLPEFRQQPVQFLQVLLAVFIPSSAVNLTDYFLVRRGNYDVTAFFIPNGAYGRFAWRGLLAYAIGLAAEWPFVSQLDTPGRWSRIWAAGFHGAGQSVFPNDKAGLGHFDTTCIEPSPWVPWSRSPTRCR
jgi:Permease for cytosine/purines, uracil, thiamine, allantoin